MRPPFSYLLLALLVLGCFYPSIFAESLSIDDHGMIQGYLNMNGLDWQGLFWPSSSPYYYRPLLGLTFYWDHIFFDNHGLIAHLENILLHLASTIFLYGILRHFVTTPAKNDWPLLVALFFGIHPLTTEPVNWISGRTDLLAGFFILASFLLFLRNREKKLGHDILAAFLFLCGLWSKEVAIGLLPVILFACLQEQSFAIKRQWRSITSRIFPFLTATSLYGLMRAGGQIGHDIGVMTAIHGGHGAEHFAFSIKIMSLIKAIGFYSQKIIWPLPLNFAIVEINRPVALAVGIMVLTCLTLALRFYRRRPVMLGIVWIFCFLAPALPVAVNYIAWTPLAERYLYLPLMGLCLAMTILLGNSPPKKIITVSMLLLLFGFGTATAQRNIVWQKNITLWRDVVEKSPNFAPGHNDYAIALLRDGKKEEADKHLAIAESLAVDSGKSRIQGNIMALDGDIERQSIGLDAILEKEQQPKLRKEILYKAIRLISNELIHKEIKNEKRVKWTRKLLTYQKELATLDKNPYHQYRIGQLHLALEENIAAQAAFAITCQTSNDYFTQPACALAKRLKE